MKKVMSAVLVRSIALPKAEVRRMLSVLKGRDGGYALAGKFIEAEYNGHVRQDTFRGRAGYTRIKVSSQQSVRLPSRLVRVK